MDMNSIYGRKLWKSVIAACVVIGLLFYLHFSHHPGPNSTSIRGGGLHPDEELPKSIANSTLGFQRIYAINLPTRTDRRDGLSLVSSLTGIQLDWVDGVDGHDVPDKALPYPASREAIANANIGSWRAHLNTLKDIVAGDLGSALILEDDVDWDIRIREQLQDFALTSRALLQPLTSPPHSFADPTLQDPARTTGMPKDIDFDQLPSTIPPSQSPYGDNWDVLWLGHCGTEFPNANLPAKADLSSRLPRGRAVHANDATVPENEHLAFLSDEDDPRRTYRPHTRVTHHPMGSICSLAYAVSKRGARRLLYELGVNRFDSPFDIMLRDVCEGAEDRSRGVCLTVQPPLFNHHRPAGHSGFYSDISVHPDEIAEVPRTDMIRYSARLNIPKLILGRTDYDDQFPDKNA